MPNAQLAFSAPAFFCVAESLALDYSRDLLARLRSTGLSCTFSCELAFLPRIHSDSSNQVARPTRLSRDGSTSLSSSNERPTGLS